MESTAGPSREQAPPSQSAGSPYDSAARADIILRSSDLIDFYVLKTFLSYVSPFFEAMFTLPSSTTNEIMNDLPVIPVEETSETINLLLELIYPHIGEPKIDNVALFLNVCKATRKYCMNIIENRLMKQIVTLDLMISEPLRVYAVAIDLNWGDVALIAARNASKISLDKLPYAEELQNISGSDFYRFLDYKLRCDTGSFEDYMKTFPIASVVSIPEFQVLSPSVEHVQKLFENTAKADIVLRSKDLVDFFVLEDLVRAASSSPNTTIPLGIAIGKTANGQTIIDVAEDSKVLRHLLSFIYHISDELDIQNCRLYIQVVLAARRYGMTIIETRLRKQAAVSPIISRKPLRMYIVASALGWAELAKSAAINTLSKPLQDMTYMVEFDLITGADLYWLVSFRFRCVRAACNVINGNSGYRVYGPGKWTWAAPPPPVISPKSRHRLSDPAVLDVGRQLPADGLFTGPGDPLIKKLKSCPRGSTVKDAYHLEDKALQSQNPQITLGGSEFIKMLECRRQLEDAVEVAVAKVPLDLAV